MLNIEEDDYTHFPVALANEVKSITMTIQPLIPLKFAETGAYKYTVGQPTANHIMDLTPDENNAFTYSEDNPEFGSSLILYYKISHD